MSRLTRYGTAEPVSQDQILRREWGPGNIHFPCSADHEQDWQPYPVDLYSADSDQHVYGTFNMPTSSELQHALVGEERRGEERRGEERRGEGGIAITIIITIILLLLLPVSPIIITITITFVGAGYCTVIQPTNQVFGC